MVFLRKQIAWFFILLLAGHEVIQAKRFVKTEVSEMNKSTKSQPPAPQVAANKAEAVWRAENEECRSKLFSFECNEGAKHALNATVRHCAKQPLSGDFQASTKCRVTDAWMLKGSAEKPTSWWLDLQIKQLKAKTDKLEEKCGAKNKKRSQWRCARRMQHVLRAVKFIGKTAKGEALKNLTPEQVKEAQDAADVARERIGKTIISSPQKQTQLSRLAEALKKDKHGLEQNPKATISKVLRILQENILPDDADPKAADAKIQQMELQAAKPADQEDKEALEAHVKELEQDTANAPSDVDDTFDDTVQEMDDDVAAGEAKQGNGTSLVQLREDSTAVKTIGVIIIVILLVVAINALSAYIWGMLIFWIAASVLGCTVIAVNKKLCEDMNECEVFDGEAKSSLRWWGGCVAKWIAKPITLTFRATKWIYKKLSKNDSSLLQIDSGVNTYEHQQLSA